VTTEGEAGRAKARREARESEVRALARQVEAREREVYLLASGYLDEMIAAIEEAENPRRTRVRKSGDPRKVSPELAEVRA